MTPLTRTYFLGMAITAGVTAVTLSMGAWAPGALRALESVAEFQLKPWIYFGPALLALCAGGLAVPRYRNLKSWITLLLGGLSLALAAIAALLALLPLVLPTLRY